MGCIGGGRQENSKTATATAPRDFNGELASSSGEIDRLNNKVRELEVSGLPPFPS